MKASDSKKKECQIIESIKHILDLVSDDIKGYRIVLFGSRATGDSRERSDFDIGVIGLKKLPLQIFYKIESLLDEIDTLYSIDFVDMHEVSASFRSNALSKTEVLYG